MNKTQRKNDKLTVGLVNSPTDKIPSSNEGGTVVKLLVLDDCREYHVCSGDRVAERGRIDLTIKKLRALKLPEE